MAWRSVLEVVMVADVSYMPLATLPTLDNRAFVCFVVDLSLI